jgi:16S rRNA (guanine1207-N2)-methyltransferase
MIDNALQIIQPHLQNLHAPTLWFADENAQPLLELINSDEHLTIVTNRFDIYQQASTKNIQVVFSDFNIDDYPKIQFQKIVYRISKEKPVVHTIVNQAANLLIDNLSADGLLTNRPSLFISGYKQEGIKSYADKLKKTLTAQGTLKKQGSCYSGEFTQFTKNTLLDDKSYSNLQKITIDNNKNTRNTRNTNSSIANFYSKPGVFGWNKIDQGTELLLQALKTLLADNEIKPNKILDLGCGYGWIFLNIDTFNFEKITATDNNAAAIIAAKKNSLTMKTPTHVVVSDCGNTINDAFDLVLSNPPFHQGFQHVQTLTEKFIKSCHQRVNKGGHVLLVTNEFVAFDKLVKRLFTHKKTLLKEQGFKVILLTK